MAKGILSMDAARVNGPLTEKDLIDFAYKVMDMPKSPTYRGKLKFYDRNGTPLDPVGHAHLLSDPEYKRVERSVLPNNVEISTVWLGYDHSPPGCDIPIIFETLVSGGPKDSVGRSRQRYATEEEAIKGHWQIVQSIQVKQYRAQRWEKWDHDFKDLVCIAFPLKDASE